MRKLLPIAFVASVLCFAPLQAKAEDIDVAKVPCKSFLSEKDQLPLMIMWIDGYLSGKSDNTTLSNEWIEKLGKHLGEYCAKNPEKPIMDAIEAMPSE